ncbi:MAG: CBS domain-containing protein, partial [Chloroflexi bacterium]
MKKIKVEDIASPNIIYIDANSTVREAADLMKNNNISSLLVKEGEKFIGIITDKDFVTKLPYVDKSCSSVKVKEILSSLKLITVEKDAGLEEAAELMRKKKIRHLVVVD